ncbi:hypothetical protein PVAG01_08421 [Phlyctema vagabunda]|uniref:Uncharacterized protein n=1 Tax=Phlyctema vagabunda TaxID=108571 RepID=A0ABR4P9J4_9HELO
MGQQREGTTLPSPTSAWFFSGVLPKSLFDLEAATKRNSHSAYLKSQSGIAFTSVRQCQPGSPFKDSPDFLLRHPLRVLHLFDQKCNIQEAALAETNLRADQKTSLSFEVTSREPRRSVSNPGILNTIDTRKEINLAILRAAHATSWKRTVVEAPLDPAPYILPALYKIPGSLDPHITAMSSKKPQPKPAPKPAPQPYDPYGGR